MSCDAYEVAAYVKHYQAKNGYAPKRDELTDGQYRVTPEAVDLLVKNGILELRALFEGGPFLFVVLTEKGLRMANEASGRRLRTRRASGRRA